MEELRPCPCCGSSPRYVDIHTSIKIYRCEAENHSFAAFGKTEEEARSEWNRRYQPDRVGHQEVAELLERIAQKVVGVTVHPDSDTWEIFAGNVEFVTTDGWRVTVFNDCDEMDYIDSVVAPDGREAEFEEWVHPDWREPIDMMDRSLRSDLEVVLRTATYEASP